MYPCTTLSLVCVCVFRKSSQQNKGACLTLWPFRCTGRGSMWGITWNIWKTLTSAKWMGGCRCLVFCGHFVIVRHSQNVMALIPDGAREHILWADVTCTKQCLRHHTSKMDDTFLNLALLQYLFSTLWLVSVCQGVWHARHSVLSM